MITYYRIFNQSGRYRRKIIAFVLLRSLQVFSLLGTVTIGKMRFISSAVLALTATLASAHYNFERLIVNGKTTEPYEYVRALGPGVGNGPFYDVKHTDIRCNNGSFAAASKTKTYAVKAGDTLGFTIRDVLGHPGPLFAYMSKSTVANVSQYQGEGDWFKIYEMGVKTYANYSLAMTWLSDGWKSFNFKIPKDIENGQYLLRAEHIAIHPAGGPDGAGSQFYIGCAQIAVSGATGKKPSPVGKFPGICKLWPYFQDTMSLTSLCR